MQKTRTQPLPQQPRLADAAPSIDHQQPASFRRPPQLAQLAFPVDEIHPHDAMAVN
jgi:hypothetical protein